MSKRRLFAGLAITTVMILIVGVYLVMPIRFYPSDPADAEIIFDDLRAFAHAHEIARTRDFDSDAYHEHYFDNDSAPVKSLVSMVDLSARETATHARQYPANYDAITTRIALLESAEPAVRDAYRKLEEIYPDAVFPPVYLAFSGFKARGLIRPYGVIIGGEYFIGQESDSEAEGWYGGRKLIFSPEHLPGHFIHEMAHIQQARNSPITFVSTGNVLNWTIFEGAADFVANAITGTHSNTAGHDFLAKNGDTLWCAFYDSMDASRRTYWMDSDVFGVPPGGFAAAFGYQIVSAYYENQVDKRQALIDLIELADYDEILAGSGYMQKLERLCGK